jgi:DNA polymerase III gamma/tau subunit
VCAKEAISIDPAALAVLIEETDGSARDALNLIEQVRFIDTTITEASIRTILGKLSTTVLLDLLEAVINNDPAGVLAVLSSNALQGANPQATWDLLVNAVKSLLWLKYASNTISGEFSAQLPRMQTLAASCSHNRLLAIMQLLWDQETVFLQTSKKQLFLEFLFLQLAEQDNIASIDDLLRGYATAPASAPTRMATQATLQRTVSAPQVVPPTAPTPRPATAPAQATPQPPTPAQPATTPADPQWAQFLTALRTAAPDAVLLAILEQAIPAMTTPTEMTLALRHNSKFFTDKLDEMRPTWLSILQEIFGPLSKVEFSQQAQPVDRPKLVAAPAPTPEPTPRPQQPQSVNQQQTYGQKNFKSPQSTKPQELAGEFVNPAQVAPFADLLVTHFPGKLKRLKNFN